MKFTELAKYLKRLERTSSRLEITQILAELFKKSNSNEIDKIVYLVLGTLAPSYENVVFNLAERMMLQVIAKAFKKDLAEVKKLYKQKGDLGEVAQEFSKSTGKNLSVTDVFDELYKIAKDEGEGSQERKIKKTAKLLSMLDPLSARFVTRIPVSKLRLGFSDKTILDALSWMENGDKSAKKQIERAYEVTPDVGALAKKIKKMGVKKASSNYSIVLGVPVLPMLAQRLKSPAEMIEKMGKVAVEPKFDGLRTQIHFKKEQAMKAFTRNLNEISDMFPELARVGKFINAREVVLDSEAVGLDPKTRKMVDFQKTMTRRRKHDIEKISSSTPIRFQVFDLLFINGKNLMDKSYGQRRKGLQKAIKKNSILVIDESMVTDDAEVIRAQHKKYLLMGLEGAMVKKYDSKYVPGRTGWRWVKLKEVEKAQGKLADTVDCVVMGYTRGKGKRVSFGIGQFLAGIKDRNKILTVSKVGTGLTDEQFRELAVRLKKIREQKKPKEYEVHKDLEPDFWVAPKQVVEIAADEITISPKHAAGLALRFPRLIKFRDDKSVSQATTLLEIKKLFQLQRN